VAETQMRRAEAWEAFLGLTAGKLASGAMGCVRRRRWWPAAGGRVSVQWLEMKGLCGLRLADLPCAKGKQIEMGEEK